MASTTHKHILRLLLLPMLVMAYSCTPLSCFEETEAFVKASFVNNSTTKAQPPDSLTIYGVTMESAPLYNKSANVQPALLPLNPSSESCSLVVRINGVSDTVDFSYTSYPHLISKECGVTSTIISIRLYTQRT